MALPRLKKLYCAAGLPMATNELFDHSCVMPAFAALAPPGHGEALLAEHRAAIELLRLSLHDFDSLHAHVLDAVAASLAPLTVSERGEVARSRAKAHPDEAVGLEPYGPPEAMPSGAPSADVGCGGERASRQNERGRDPALGHSALRRSGHVPRRAVVALSRRPVRLDERLDPQMFEQKILGYGPAFHYGALLAIGGHVIGLMIPKSFTEAIGMSEHTYRWFSAVAGAVAGAICVVGFVGLVYRRITNVRVRRTTSRTDLAVYFLLVVLIGLGTWQTFAHNLITATPYDYRDSISEWWRSLFILQPDVEAVQGANTVYQIHAIVAWAPGAVPVQPARARVQHPAAIRRPPLHPLPPPVRPPDPSARDEPRHRHPAGAGHVRVHDLLAGWLARRSRPTSRRSSACRTSRRPRWSPSPCCSVRSCGSRSAGSPTGSAAGGCSPR